MGALGAKAKMTIATAGVAAAVIREKVRPPRPPATLDDVPTSAEHLTPEWLTAVLCRHHPDTRVESITLGEANNGTSARRVVALAYSGPGADELPATVFTKSSPSFTSRLVLGLTGAAQGECFFYNELQSRIAAVNTPTGYFGAYDRVSRRSMVVLEDCVATRGATFGDALQALNRAEADDVVDQLALIHGAFWNDRILDQPTSPLQSTREFARGFDDMIGCRCQSQVGIDRAHDLLPQEFLADRHDFYDPFLDGLGRDLRQPRTLVHQDPHPGNWFRDRDGRMGLYDWQGVATGHWAVDLCYALQAALTVEDRRAWESELVLRYVERLAEAGGPSISYANAWLDYRTHPYHGLVFWLYTLGRNRLQPKMQPDDFSREIIKRMTRATVDHDTLALLKVQNKSA
jgi:Phosphotransferase enzyme family